MSQATDSPTTPAPTHPPHLTIWLDPKTAPKIEKLPYVTWAGHLCVHATHALNETAPEDRGALIKHLLDFLHRQEQTIARRDKAKAKQG
jgi:hypothetical protein